MHAGFEAYQAKTFTSRDGAQLLQDAVRDTASAQRVAHVHPLEFRKIGEQRHAAAADRFAVQTRDEEPDMRLEDRVQRKAMPLLRLVEPESSASNSATSPRISSVADATGSTQMRSTGGSSADIVAPPMGYSKASFASRNSDGLAGGQPS